MESTKRDVMKFTCKRAIIWLILFALSIGCAPTPRATPTLDQSSPIITRPVDAPYGTPPAQSPDGNSYMQRLVVAPDGGVWFSFGSYDWNHLDGGGLTRYDHGQVTHFTVEDGLPGNNVQALRAAPDGTIWIGALCGIARYDGHVWHTVNEVANCQSVGGTVIDFAFTPDGNVWVGTSFGVARFDGTPWTIVERAAVRQLLAHGDGSVWGIKDDNSLVHYTGTISQALTNLSFDQIDELVRGPNDDLWGITDRGVVRLDGSQWQRASNLPDNITQLAFAPDGSIWVGDRTGVLSRIDPTAIRLETLLPRPSITPSVIDPSLPIPPPLPTPYPLPTQP
jgi:ligand-binding sensor domain-containing protein